MGWSGEQPAGGVGDELYSSPEKLWVGSANFTASSRRSLESGTPRVQARRPSPSIARATATSVTGMRSYSGTTSLSLQPDDHPGLP